MRLNQIRLLLKGDASMVGRIMKIQHQTSNVRDLLLAAAKRYHMMPISSSTSSPTQRPSTTRAPQAEVAAKPDREKQASHDTWQQVTGRKRQKSAKQDEALEQPNSVMTLYSEDWTHPVLDTVQLGKSGILLSTDLAHAEKLSKALRRSQVPVAVLSISKLDGATICEYLTFRVLHRSKQQSGEYVSREKTLTGFLCNFARQPLFWCYMSSDQRSAQKHGSW